MSVPKRQEDSLKAETTASIPNSSQLLVNDKDQVLFVGFASGTNNSVIYDCLVLFATLYAVAVL